MTVTESPAGEQLENIVLRGAFDTDKVGVTLMGGTIAELVFRQSSPERCVRIQFVDEGTESELAAALARQEAVSAGFESWIGAPLGSVTKIWKVSSEEVERGEVPKAVKKVPPVPIDGVHSPAQQVVNQEVVGGDWLAEVQRDLDTQPWIVCLGALDHPLVEHVVLSEWDRLAAGYSRTE
jgi:hypothetical protein